jgi:hypothetical protein
MSRFAQGHITKSKKWPAHPLIVGVVLLSVDLRRRRSASRSAQHLPFSHVGLLPQDSRAKALIMSGSRLEKGKLSLFSLSNDGCCG